MRAGRAPRGPKHVASRAHDLAWTAIAVVVVIAVAIAAGAFYWFIY
jgi:flagellar basal body-associated protein FliL